MSIRVQMDCCASCAGSEFGGTSAKFYRHPRFPALSTTSLWAPFSLPKRCSVNDSEGNEGLSCSLLPLPLPRRLNFRVLTKFGRLYRCLCFMRTEDSGEYTGTTQRSRALGINTAKTSGPTVQIDVCDRSGWEMCHVVQSECASEQRIRAPSSQI